ncbi:hypothetical protein [Aneurinibacillus aneurinilyticus]|nr:hypothetical protein [Aneurinibacillus aneurinilyticus]MED0704917.1 hypothetical protein [Aneurinibacillus aneurinilyticus]MED0724041.1 hypothetical protein [Aneurinibacillus aneurinilyticus]MED0731962.1 hypothetical protein [Aneurinibacillus aneurinilyticus]MED0741508.1 hypothetical protein [Aneurinibacillus aneurinilyticus]
MELTSKGTLYFDGKPIAEVLNVFFKRQEAKDYTPIATQRKFTGAMTGTYNKKALDNLVSEVGKHKTLYRLHKILHKTKKQRIKRKVASRISQMEQWS